MEDPRDPNQWPPPQTEAQRRLVTRFRAAYDDVTAPRRGRFEYEAGGDFVSEKFPQLLGPPESEEDRDALRAYAAPVSWALADLLEVFPCPLAAAQVARWFRTRASFAHLRDDPEVRRAETAFLRASGALVPHDELLALRRAHVNARHFELVGELNAALKRRHNSHA